MSTKLSYEIRNMSTTEKVVGVAVLAAAVYGVWGLLTYEPKKYPKEVLPPGEVDDWGVSTSWGVVDKGAVDVEGPGIGEWRIYRRPDARYAWYYRAPSRGVSEAPFVTQEEARASLAAFFLENNIPFGGGG